MKRVRVIDTSGRALDWLVAKALGRLDQRVQPDPRPGTSAIDIGVSDGKVLVFDYDKIDYVPFRPSTDWAQGGPITDDIEGLYIKRWVKSSPGSKCHVEIHNYDGDWVQFGPTLLIAAMRCYVASKLGDEVEVPEELL